MVNANLICATALVILMLGIENSDSKIWKSKCPELDIPNANIRIRAKGRLAKIRCNSGYTIIAGDRRLSCIRKEWQGTIPHCIKNGCEEESLENGMVIKLYGGALIHFVCNPGYSLEGSPAVFCDGFNWNSTTPECQVPPPRLDHSSCSFEYKDLCGWTQDHLDDFDWKWSSALINSFQGGFGAKVDHTFGMISGHYVYADSNEKWRSNAYARLFSPILQVPLETPACVTFYYHLYGPTSGVFNVFIKPESILFEEIYPDMSVTGFHADEWLMAFLHLDDSVEDYFQVILEAQGGNEHVSDFAVDDFQVSAGEDCINLELQYEEQQRTTTLKPAEPEHSSTITMSLDTLTTDPDQEGEDFTTLYVPSSTFENSSSIASLILTSTGDEEIFSTTSPLPATSTTEKKTTETTTIPRRVIIITTPRTLKPFTIFTPPNDKLSSTLIRKTLTPSIPTTQKTTTKLTTTTAKITPLLAITTTTKSTSNLTTEASTTTAISLKTNKTTYTTAKPTKTTKLTTKSRITPTKTTTSTTTESTTKTTTTPKPPRRKTTKITKPSTTTTSTSSAISTESSSTEFYFDLITTRKAIKVTENMEAISKIKKDTSNGGAAAVILGVAICFLVIGSAFAFFWHTKRKRQLLAEDSDERRLKEESKDEEQSNEVEEASRRPFTTSYRLLENKNYPQEYDGTPV